MKKYYQVTKVLISVVEVDDEELKKIIDCEEVTEEDRLECVNYLIDEDILEYDTYDIEIKETKGE